MKYSIAVLGLAAATSAQRLTSVFNITATPDQVVNGSSISTPGQPGAKGQFNYALYSDIETICYDITLTGVTGEYRSPARTATHIHEAAKGRNGPPRIAFPNPVGDDTFRRSVGCITGPFTTGIKAADNVTDTGAGFSLKKIEANPAGFFTDSHTALFVAGVVRGQLDQSFKIIGGGSPTGVPKPTGTGGSGSGGSGGSGSGGSGSGGSGSGGAGGSGTSPTSPPIFTGAASTVKAGGVVAAIAVLAAFL